MHHSKQILLALTLAFSASACTPKPESGSTAQPNSANTVEAPKQDEFYGPKNPDFFGSLMTIDRAMQTIEQGGSPEDIQAAKEVVKASLDEANMALNIRHWAALNSQAEPLPPRAELAPESDTVTQDDRNTLAELLKAAIAEASESDAAIDGLDKRAEIAAERIIKYLTESLTGKINVHALIQELSAKDVPVRREDKHIRRIFFAHGITLPGEENNGIGGDGYLIKTPTGSLNENFFQYYGQEDLSQLIVFEGETK